MTLYKHTQYGKLITVIISIVAITTLTIFILQTGNNPMPWIMLVSILLLFLLILLSFYKLTITIDKEKIEAKFGIGLIKRSLKIKDIHYDSIEKIKVPALYGIGIRLTPQGWLYNVNTGNAIKVKSNTKTFFVGTEDFEKINTVLMGLKNKNE
ncbi:hypothetical protein [Lacinutrix jangbogonensis]|uniref:hypothetical protein n=1 Tax=Lacinutrix jangbogonensis TaxID=1469557 RepID=UPI00053EE358|nr:hypothetical protein [Lacinutrix jangbogonensis]